MIELTTYTTEGMSFFIREGTSDTLVVNEVLWADEYRQKNGMSGVVIDVGANIGVFSIMAVYYGAEHVWAFEPEEDNLRVARTNIALHGYEDRITLVPNAVYEDGVDEVRIVPMEGSTAVEDHGVAVEAVSLNSILEGHSHVTYLKMDVEGSEVPIIRSTHSALLDQVSQLSMEYHGQTDDWGDMIRILSGVFDLEIIGHPFPGEFSGGMLYGVNKTPYAAAEGST